MKTVYIIHGWGGSPDEPLHKWLKKNLEERGYKVVIPEMPETETPHINTWVNKIEETVKLKEQAVLIGHSIGCQAILRYLSKLGLGEKVNKVVFIAPWSRLNMDVIEAEGERSVEIANEWINTPINFVDAMRHIEEKVVAIFSDNDPVVPLSEKDVFKKEMNAEIIIENGKGHFTEDDGVVELPVALEAIIKI